MKNFLKYLIPIQMGGQNKWLCPYSPIGWSVAAGILLGYIFIEKSLTGALLGFFIGGILGEVLAFFRKKSNQ
jgi:hypothetical protein|tara:strand:- start:76 stop:291 length:216 start_codon:yes stop_codon:yes gene_type:complete